jgi:hypothetical protein
LVTAFVKSARALPPTVRAHRAAFTPAHIGNSHEDRAMKTIAAVCLSGSLLFPLFAVAADAQPPASHTSAPTHVKRTSTYQFAGTITAIDLASRVVALSDGAGQTFVFHVGPTAKNFDQLKVSDHVVLKVTRALVASVSKGTGIRSTTETVTATSASLGALPSGTVQAHTRVVADVLGVDRKRGILKLKGPQGDVIEAAVERPKLLEGVKVGDQITLDYTEAVAVDVTRKP